jgi:hypothetical protein
MLDKPHCLPEHCPTYAVPFEQLGLGAENLAYRPFTSDDIIDDPVRY